MSTVHTVDRAISYVRTQRADAVLLEPAQLDVAELVAELRARTELPIIVVSEGNGETDPVSSLDAGADDYISKPFRVEELLARMRAALRRMSTADAPAPIVTDDFTIDIARGASFTPTIPKSISPASNSGW